MSLAQTRAHILNNKLAHLGTFSASDHGNPAWAVSLDLRGEYVLNGFFLYSILLDKAERKEHIILSTTEASQRDRLKEVLAERNKRVEGVGQEEYGHACDLCFVVFDDEQGRQGAY